MNGKQRRSAQAASGCRRRGAGEPEKASQGLLNLQGILDAATQQSSSCESDCLSTLLQVGASSSCASTPGQLNLPEGASASVRLLLPAGAFSLSSSSAQAEFRYAVFPKLTARAVFKALTAAHSGCKGTGRVQMRGDRRTMNLGRVGKGSLWKSLRK